jgi:hypothetical protein
MLLKYHEDRIVELFQEEKIDDHTDLEASVGFSLLRTVEDEDDSPDSQMAKEAINYFLIQVNWTEVFRLLAPPTDDEEEVEEEESVEI